MAAAAEDAGPRRTASGRLLNLKDLANAPIIEVAIIRVSPLRANKCLYNAIGQAMERPKIFFRETQGDVEWVAQRILEGLENINFATDMDKIDLYGIQDPDNAPVMKEQPSRSRAPGQQPLQPLKEIPPDNEEGWKLWKKYYKKKEDVRKRANGGVTEMFLFANSYPGTVSFLVFSEDKVSGDIDVYAVTREGREKAALLPSTEEIVLHHWFDGHMAHFDRVEFTVHVHGEKTTLSTWPWAGTETRDHEVGRRDMILKVIQANRLRRQINEYIATIEQTPSLLDNAPRELLISTRDALLRLAGPRARNRELPEAAAAAAAAAPRPLRSIAPLPEAAAAAAAAAPQPGPLRFPVPPRSKPAAAAASGGAAAAAAAAEGAAPLVRPGTIGFYQKHWGKLQKQRDLLYNLAASRDLCAVGGEAGVYAVWPRPPQTEPTGHTVQLNDYVLYRSLESKVEIRGTGDMLGVFAKEFLDEKIYGPRALQRATPKQMLQRVLPYRGVVMTNDVQSCLEYEFACPTAIALKEAHEKDITRGELNLEDLSLIGCPTSAAVVINSFDNSSEKRSREQKKRVADGTNCRFVVMTAEEYEEYGTVQVGNRAHLSDHFLHVCLTKDVKKGEELIIDYGTGFWEQEEAEKARGVAACEECQITMQGHVTEDAVGTQMVGPQMENWFITEMERHINDARVKGGLSRFHQDDFELWHMAECHFEGCGRAIHKFHWPRDSEGKIVQPEQWFCSLHGEHAASAAAAAAASSASAPSSASPAAASAASASPAPPAAGSTQGSPARNSSKPQAQEKRPGSKKKRKAPQPVSEKDKRDRARRVAAQRAQRAAKAAGAGPQQQASKTRGRVEKNMLDLTLSDSSDSSKEDDGAPRLTQYRRASLSVLEAERAAAAALAADEMFPELPGVSGEDDEEEFYAPPTPQTPDSAQAMTDAMLRLRLDRNHKSRHP